MVELYQIYLITNTINNKRYVGQVIKHRGYQLRWKEHINGIKYANTRLLSNAINKYGKDAFNVQLIEDDIPENLIDEREKYYITKFNTFYQNTAGYNMTIGGQGVHQYEHTEADKLKIAESSKRFWKELKANPEKFSDRNNKISQKLKGRPKSDVTKEKLSVAAKNRFKNSPGTFKGKHHTEKSKYLVAIKNGYKVAMIDQKSNEILKIFISTSAAGRFLVTTGCTKNISCATRIRTICEHVQGQGKTAYGYKWEYIE